MATPVSPVLSSSQLATLAEHGEERTAAVGDTLFRVGERRYPFIAILEGEAAVLDAAGREIVRHGSSGLLGEMNLLSGQTVFLTAVVTQPMRYIAVDRDALRPLLFEDGPLADLLLSNFMLRRETLQRRQGIGVEVVGPRSSAAAARPGWERRCTGRRRASGRSSSRAQRSAGRRGPRDGSRTTSASRPASAAAS